ncbi:MAG: hypothetical protein IJV27_06755 [Prevotella sp.]|nr:hypothetical protein [Prevotella sp.]
MENIGYYIAMLVALIVGILLIKKIASCLFRIVITIIMLGVFAYALHYLGYL